MTLLTEGTDYKIVGIQRGDCYNAIVIQTINTVDAGDTIAVDMTKYGINATGLIGLECYKHTTDDSIAVSEANTCAVSSGTITVTILAGTDNDPRFILIKGFTIPNYGAAI